MSEWREYSFEQIAEPIKEIYNPTGKDDLIYIGLEHIEQETLRLNSIGHSTDVTSNKFKFQVNDVLFGKLRPYFRKVVKAKFSGICSTDIWVFRAKEGFSQNFLFYFTANWDFIDTASVGEGGTRMPRADWNFLRKTKWLLPPLPEQRAIAAVLSSLDDKIDLLHRQNKTLEAMAEALFRQWFIEPTKDGLPEGWEEVRLVDILSIIESGSRPKGGIDPNLKDGIPSIGAENINGLGNYDYSKIKYISKEFYNSMKRGRIHDYDVLIYKDGAYIGKKAMFGKGYPFEKATINEHVFILRGNNKVNQFFLYFLLNQQDLEQLNSNSVQPGLNQEAIKSFEIIIPSFNLISSFGELTKTLVDKIFSNSIQICTLEKLRDTLLPKLMSGEVRVKV